MTSKKYIFGAFAFAFASIVGAATQGSAGSTSTGTFTNTFGDSSRVIQVLGLQDMQFTTSAGVIVHSYGQSQGVADKFCVIDSAKGVVRVQMYGSEKVRPHGWLARAVDQSGWLLEYNMSLQQPGDPNWYGSDIDTDGIELSGNELVEDANGCANGGNVGKAISLKDNFALPSPKLYKDTVTVKITPQ
jgi:hypothetical protein